MNRPHPFVVIFALLTLSTLRAGDGGGSDYNLLSRPLSKIDALNLALLNNSTILKAQKDVEAAFGVAIQVRAIVFPKINHSANYRVRQDSLIEANRNRELPSKTVKLAGLGPIRLGEGAMPRTLEIMPRTLELGGGTTPRVNNQDWAAEVRVVQSLYEGGRMLSALRSSKLIRGQALLTFESTVADTLLSVSNAYDTVLSTEKQIEVRTAAVTFLSAYLKDTKIRNAVGDLPEFDVVRQEVEVANAVAQKVQAVGDHRVAKQNLVQLLGYDLPITVSDDIPLKLTTPLESRPYPNSLATALANALVNRAEIAALETEELLRNEAIIVAKAGAKPSVQAFAGYEVTSRMETRAAGDQLHGGFAGGQVSWPIFDGFLTKGRVEEAIALRDKAGEARLETTRIVELQVRTAWSNLRTARAVLDAQTKNVEKAVRGLELAQARYKEGAGTQIDVLNAQTALTEARGSYVEGLRGYSVARTELLRATGADLLRFGKVAK